MTEQEIRDDAAISYANDILEGLDQIAEFSDRKESITIKKVISSIEAMMAHDFHLTVEKLDS